MLFDIFKKKKENPAESEEFSRREGKDRSRGERRDRDRDGRSSGERGRNRSSRHGSRDKRDGGRRGRGDGRRSGGWNGNSRGGERNYEPQKSLRRDNPNKQLKTSINISKDDDKVYFGALGGMGEFGCNLYLYGYKGDWIIVDLGIGFPDERMMGAESVIPDTSFLKSIKNKILGIFLTHSHYDHFSAIPQVWNEIGCPVYGSPFAIGMLEHSLEEYGLKGRVELHRIPKEGSRFNIGEFDMEYMHVTHSTLQSNFIILRTAQGIILHTGDFRFDPKPLIDEPTDLDRLKELGREGVTAVISDSTNSLDHDKGSTEESAKLALEAEVKKIKSGKIVLTCFATNIVRMSSIATIAESLGRKLCVIGRALENNWRIAKDLGYLEGLDFMTAEEVRGMNDDEVIYLCSGTQGEPKAQVTRLSEGTSRKLKLKDGDTVIFSSKIIPGNEKVIFAVQNSLAKMGVNVVSVATNPTIHNSGHPTIEDMTELYNFTKPAVAIPMHGEFMQLRANEKIAKDCGVKGTLVIENGQFVALEKGKAPYICETISIESVVLDGNQRLDPDADVFENRRLAGEGGALFITLTLKKDGVLSGKPKISSVGVFESDKTGMIKSVLLGEVSGAVARLDKETLASDNNVAAAIERAVAKVVKENIEKTPVIEVHVNRTV
jgi:ribonuclease J